MPTETEESLLARLLALPANERKDYLRRACEENPHLRGKLRELTQTLSFGDSANVPRPLPASDADHARALQLAFSTDENTSTSIGPYKLLQKIGEGGFGVVWMAEQQFPVRRRVALKIIKSGMDTHEVIARFETERQALALMDHPNIARVFDAGETDAGRPYFVMELVRGIPITRYCDENNVPTEARLQLFIAVCYAVQHAHQKGIIHRDLKPSNIIVTLHDGAAMPKIIDFGIAKATEAPLTERTLFTQFHAFIGTPAYTSPEQMEMSGLDVDTRSDIYSLGILLYELLTGRPPFDPDELVQSGLEEMRRTIREVDPPRPSQRLRTLSEDVRISVARQRDTEATKLSATLSGDLDWIVMHCLEKDRARRYDTANGLASDVRHYLNDEPITARPPGAAYRFGKFIRRNKLAVAAGTAIGVSILAGLVLSSSLLLREQAARKRAVLAETTESRLRREAEIGRERETALRQQADANARETRLAAARSEQTAQFMKSMLAGVGPSVALGRDTTLLREVLDATAKRLDKEFQDQPEVAADLRDTLGTVYFDLGHYATAEKLLRDAVDGRRRLFGNENDQLATSLEKLGVVLSSLNKLTEAESALREAIAIRRKLNGEEHTSVATALHHLATAMSRQGKFAESTEIRRDVLDLRRKLLGDEHSEVADSIASLGAHEESLAMRRRLLGNDHPDVAKSLVGLAHSLPVSDQGKALEAYREAFVIRRKMLGDGHPQVTATLLRYLSALAFQAPLEEAAPLAREIIASTRKNLGNDSVALAPSLLALASLLYGDEKHASEARALIAEAHTLLEKSRAIGPQLDSETIFAMQEFSHGMVLSGQPARGLAMAEEMVAMARSAFGETHPLTINAMRPLARIYFSAARFTEARSLFEKSLAGMRKLNGPGHPMSLGLLSGVAASNRRLGDFPRARREIEEGLALLKQTADPTEPPDPAISTVLLEWGLILYHETKFVEAGQVLSEAIGHHERARPDAVFPRFRPLPELQSALGLALAGQGRFDEAEPLVVDSFQKLNASNDPFAGSRRDILRDALERVTLTYTSWGKPDKAEEWRARFPELNALQPSEGPR